MINSNCKLTMGLKNVKYLIALIIIICSIIGVYNAPTVERKMRICSRSLSNTLALVCKGKFNTWNDTSEPHVNENDGIVHECCIEGCTLKQLEQYCLT